ncbi:MAG TPA: glycosyltransferase [Candidatus Saccharibacteria bacterium]|nr:glycosyltransferase [Candidatus Saccharibacteria bacterium]
MKILIASDLYWPTINGVSTFSRNLAHGLASRGHEVIVIAPSQTGNRYEEIDGNYKIYRTISVPFPFYQNFRISIYPFREVRKIIDNFKPDIIHIQMQMSIGQAVMRHGQKCGIPIISTNHAMPENLMDNLKHLAPIARPINYMIKVYGMRFHSKSDYITLPTRSAIEMSGLDLNKSPVPIEAISNGIDLSSFTPENPDKKIFEKFKIPKDRPIIFYIGRLDAEKHLPVLLRAFVRVVSSKDAHLMIVGDGTDADNLRQITREFGISRKVTFTGRVSEKDKIELIKAGSIFCMTSPVELQSIATLEAMASGKPIVAVDAGALNELCQDKINGFLCEQDNDEQIARGILNLISDFKLYEKMSKESLAIARTHDIKKTIERFEEIYSSLINAYS